MAGEIQEPFSLSFQVTSSTIIMSHFYLFFYYYSVYGCSCRIFSNFVSSFFEINLDGLERLLFLALLLWNLLNLTA